MMAYAMGRTIREESDSGLSEIQICEIQGRLEIPSLCIQHIICFVYNHWIGLFLPFYHLYTLNHRQLIHYSHPL